MRIKLDDLTSAQVVNLIREHLIGMSINSPSESVHALDVEQLRKPDITFWSAWEEFELVGCGALKEINSLHGEIKSMRTASSHLRKGVSKSILHHIINESRQRGYRKLSLETGSMEAFEPARNLYSSFGFVYCPPFSDYTEDPNSVYMTMDL
ncbi:GNAT family N-acetyltransferase [Cytobacillus firmus]|uniref:GNAT family N-acetyltransferase n=1 Tax=Cytobacillus firmus TaxID=1399 RepID=UPI0018CEEBE8|nr:GNAT family N-acetyltransferase [Cytobacillus firmus]MBG9587611.1 acetyltransferase [Cytobacillus firmus]